MKVVILCGGQGTRIRDVADNIPKPLIPIAGLPILWHIMKYYSFAGFNQFILCLGYKSEAIKDFFLNYENRTRDFTMTLGKNASITYHNDHAECDWQITLADTGQSAMTGARIKKIQKYLRQDENFMLTYGDGVGTIDLHALKQFHLKHQKIMTITGVRPPGRFGELRSDETKMITEFNEKPQASGGRISGGFFVCRQEIFNYLSDDDNLVFEQNPLKMLVKDKQLMVYEHDDFWQPMDTHRDYMYLNQLCEKNQAPWVVWK